MANLIHRLCLPLALTFAVGCDELPDDLAPDVVEGAWAATSTGNYFPGLVRFQLDGAGRWYTGFLALPPGQRNGTTNLVVTSAYDLPLPYGNTCLPDIEVEQGFARASSTPSTTFATVTNIHKGGGAGLLVLSLDRHLSVTNAPVMATTRPSPGSDLFCAGYGPQSGNLFTLYATAGAASHMGFLFNEAFGSSMSGELPGWICTDGGRGTWYGVTSIINAAGTSDEAVSIAAQANHIAAKRAIVDLVHPLELQRPEPLVSVSNGLVWDIPYSAFEEADVNQFPSNAQDNQSFYWKQLAVTRNGVQTTRWMLQQKGSGKCVAHTPSGIRQVTCSIADTRQLFERTAVGGFGAPAGKIDVRLRNDHTNECIVARPDATPSRQLETASCASSGSAGAWRIGDPSYWPWCWSY